MSKITDNCLHSGKERRPYGTVLGLLQGRILPQECSSSCGFCSAEDHTLENYEVASEVSLFVSPLLPGGEPQRTADVVLDKETADKKQKAIYRKNLHILSPEKRLLRSPATDINSSSSNQTGRRTPAVNARASLGIRNSMKKRNSAVPKVEGNQSFSCWRVMYGIPSSRKHKKWEDQGVLIVEDRNKMSKSWNQVCC